LRLGPLSTDHGFYDGILAVLLIFFFQISKFRHSVTKKRQLTGALPLDPTGGLPSKSPRPSGPPPFAHSKYATVGHLLSTDLSQALPCTTSLVLSRVDYCNAVLHGAPTGTILKLR